MRRVVWGVMLLGLSGGLPATAADKKADDKKPADKKADEKKPDLTASSFTSVGDVTGYVEQFKDGESITLRFTAAPAQGGGKGKGKGNQNGNQGSMFELTPDAKIRFEHLPPLLDEKGHKMPRKPEEVEKLRGDGSLPGYAAEAGDLHPNQIVKLHLVKIKGTKGPEAKAFASRILIMGELPTNPYAPTAAKKPEKKESK